MTCLYHPNILKAQGCMWKRGREIVRDWGGNGLLDTQELMKPKFYHT